MLQVAQRVQSEYSFRYVALGGTSHEDLSGLASTDEYVIIIIIIIRVFIKNSSSRRKVYSKNPHTRTPIFGVQADWVLIYRVF